MSEEIKSAIVVKIPLRVFIVSIILMLILLCSLFFGPTKLLVAYFESKAIMMKTEAVKKSIDIVGSDNFFKYSDICGL